jgi:hypothetical protein
VIVVPYSAAELVRLLVDSSEADSVFLANKQHKRFLEGYLATLGARTIVLEPEYIDRDYLRDYTGYYISCFHSYKRTTARLHFFEKEFNQEVFERLLSGDQTLLNVNTLEDTYLGFVVVKPLPQTILGRTCLKTYPADQGRRHFPVLQEYSSSLGGIRLRVRSLAFQEQDSVAAACATSALWSCFQATGKQFHHPIPSPTEITKAAVVSLPTNDVPETRTFPNRGLSATQMANAINSVGLDPQIIGATNEHLVKSTLYAYLKCNIPLIFGISLEEYDEGNALKPFKSMGRHAVATTGYSTGLLNTIPYGNGFKLYASRIDKIYVHDDQLGPFARMGFTQVNVPVINNGAPTGAMQLVPVMSTEWRSPNGRPAVIALPTIMVLPLYQKIRIPFEIIHDALLELDGMLEAVRAKFLPTAERPEWDIFLTTVSEFKNEVFKGAAGPYGKNASTVLKAQLPKYIWRVIGRTKTNPCCDLLFDATGIEQSSLLLLGRIYSPDLMTVLSALGSMSGVRARNLQTHHVLTNFAPGRTSGRALIIAP